MNCPDVERVIDAYGHAHLAGCRACRQRVDARASLGRLIRRVPNYTPVVRKNWIRTNLAEFSAPDGRGRKRIVSCVLTIKWDKRPRR